MNLIERVSKLERRGGNEHQGPLIVFRGEPDPVELAAAHAAGRRVVIIKLYQPDAEEEAVEADDDAATDAD